MTVRRSNAFDQQSQPPVSTNPSVFVHARSFHCVELCDAGELKELNTASANATAADHNMSNEASAELALGRQPRVPQRPGGRVQLHPACSGGYLIARWFRNIDNNAPFSS